MNRDILRLLDANLNRAAEGMRVLEETARMLFDDSRLTGELKDMRHTLTHMFGAESGIGRGMVLARDSEHDVLRNGETATERRRDDLGAVLRANSRRSQEAVRSLEEYVKLIAPELSGQCKALRFRLYDVEAELTARIRVLEGAGARRLGVYVVLDRESADGMSMTDVTVSAADAGAGTLVYRDKRSCDRDFRDTAERMAEVCNRRNVAFLVNERLDAALASGADGVQVGRFDLPAALCREVAGRGFIVGFFGHGDVLEPGALNGADFILRRMVEGAEPDWDVLRDEISRSALPIVVMTGFDGGDACKILECGAAGIGIQPTKYELSSVIAGITGLRRLTDGFRE